MYYNPQELKETTKEILKSNKTYVMFFLSIYLIIIATTISFISMFNNVYIDLVFILFIILLLPIIHLTFLFLANNEDLSIGELIKKTFAIYPKSVLVTFIFSLINILCNLGLFFAGIALSLVSIKLFELHTIKLTIIIFFIIILLVFLIFVLSKISLYVPLYHYQILWQIINGESLQNAFASIKLINSEMVELFKKSLRLLIPSNRDMALMFALLIVLYNSFANITLSLILTTLLLIITIIFFFFILPYRLVLAGVIVIKNSELSNDFNLYDDDYENNIYARYNDYNQY